MNDYREPLGSRIFLALWPNDAVRKQLATHANEWVWPPGCVKYMPADWHITLHFIGSVNANQLEKILASEAVPFKSFELILDWPQLWSDRLAVLCTNNVPSALLALHDQLGQTLSELDLIPQPHHYQPHVTLARRANGALPPAKFTEVVWPVQSYALVTSTGDSQQRYRVLRRYPSHPIAGVRTGH